MSRQQAIIAEFEAGGISREIALSRLLLLGRTPDAETLPAPIAELARAHQGRLEGLSALAALGFDANSAASVAALFDRLADTAPEAAVAFYALGDPGLLADATAELVAVIRAWAPVAGRRVLDFGCGIGRIAAALAPQAREVIGVDVSAGMIARARERSHAANVRFGAIAGDGLPLLGDGAVELVIAGDCFPFLVQAGILEPAIAEFARVLAPGGNLLVFNWSYRGDDAADIAEAHEMAVRHGFEVVRAGERPFAIWDGRGFHLRRR